MAVMDVVVPCDCGSRFSFAVEPVENRLPSGAELLCPTCGKDGVPLANRDPYTEASLKNDGDYYAGPNRIKGMVGALLGGVIGAAAWAGVVYFTGKEIKLVAIGVGALVGLGSRKLGGGRDYHLGLFAPLCAFMAILVGQ